MKKTFLFAGVVVMTGTSCISNGNSTPSLIQGRVVSIDSGSDAIFLDTGSVQKRKQKEVKITGAFAAEEVPKKLQMDDAVVVLCDTAKHPSPVHTILRIVR